MPRRKQATKPRQAPRIPQSLRIWYDRLVQLAQNMGEELPPQLVEHINKPTTPHLPHINPSEMSLSDVEKAFNIGEVKSFPDWDLPSVKVALPADLGNSITSPAYNGSVLIDTSYLGPSIRQTH